MIVATWLSINYHFFSCIGDRVRNAGVSEMSAIRTYPIHSDSLSEVLQQGGHDPRLGNNFQWAGRLSPICARRDNGESSESHREKWPTTASFSFTGISWNFKRRVSKTGIEIQAAAVAVNHINLRSNDLNAPRMNTALVECGHNAWSGRWNTSRSWERLGVVHIACTGLCTQERWHFCFILRSCSHCCLHETEWNTSISIRLFQVETCVRVSSLGPHAQAGCIDFNARMAWLGLLMALPHRRRLGLPEKWKHSMFCFGRWFELLYCWSDFTRSCENMNGQYEWEWESRMNLVLCFWDVPSKIDTSISSNYFAHPTWWVNLLFDHIQVENRRIVSQTADDKVHQSSLLHLVASHLRVRQLNTVTLRSHPHTPGRYPGNFTNSLWRNFVLCGGLGKFGVSSQGMCAKSLNHDVPGHLRGAVRALGSTLGGGFGLARCAMPVQFYLLWLIISIPGCTWIFMMFLVTNQLYHSMPWSGMLCVVYGIIDVKSRGSFDVKFQGHGMVILPGLRPASVDAARNKQLDSMIVAIGYHQQFWDIKICSPVSFSVLWKLALRHATRACLKEAGLPTPRTE